MEENGRRKNWKSWKDLERSWRLGPKQDPLKMIHGSPIFLKEGKETNQVSLHIFAV
jgi:hypothetical protein